MADDLTNDLIAELRRRGQRMTPQRRVVLELLEKCGHHLTVDDLSRQLAERYPTLQIDLATIYRTLKWLHENGLVSETDLGGNQLVYSLMRSHDDHHHLVCEQCQRVIEADPQLFTPLADALFARYGFRVRLAHIALFGLCAACCTAQDG
jgi:Fur family ferric uptake transcriptional regulator